MAEKLSHQDQLDRATAMVGEAIRQGGSVAAEFDCETVVTALAEDLATVTATAGRDEERLDIQASSGDLHALKERMFSPDNPLPEDNPVAEKEPG